MEIYVKGFIELLLAENEKQNLTFNLHTFHWDQAKVTKPEFQVCWS